MTAPTFGSRPTVTGSKDEGIVITVNGHDLLGVFPANQDALDDTPWSLGFWDADSGEWVDADPDGDFSAQLVKYLALPEET